MGAHDDWEDLCDESKREVKPTPIMASVTALARLKGEYHNASLTSDMTLMQEEEALTRARYYGSSDHSGHYNEAVLVRFNPAAIGEQGPIPPSADLKIVEGHKKPSGTLIHAVPLSHIAPLRDLSADYD